MVTLAQLGTMQVCTIPVGSLWQLEITVVDTTTTVVFAKWLLCCIVNTGGSLLTWHGLHSGNTLFFFSNECKVFSNWMRWRARVVI